MNLFEKIYSQVKEKVNKYNREKLLKSQYKKTIAMIEENMLQKQIALENALTNENYSFSSIVEIYEDILGYEETIENAKKCYEYIFTEKDSK